MVQQVRQKNINPEMATDAELTAGLALKYDASNPLGFETPTQLNTRDTNNRARGNHTGTQLASTISDFAASVRGTALSGLSLSTIQAILATDNILVAMGKLQAQVTANVARSTHTGTQVAATISDFGDTVRATALTGMVTTSGADVLVTDSVLIAIGKLQRNLSDAKSQANAALALKANLSGGNTFSGNQIITGGTFTLGGTTVQTSGEWNVAAGTYADPHNGALYDAKFGGAGKGLAVLGESFFNSPVSVGVNTISTSAIMELSSTTKGFLAPRMTTAQRTAISSPAQGLVVFDTDLTCYFYFDGNNWVGLSGTITKRNNTTLTNSSNTTLTNMTDLAAPVVNGKFYEIEAFIIFRSAATGTGIALTLGATGATGTVAAMVNIPIGNDGTAGQFQGQITALDDIVIGTGVQATGTDYLAKITGIFNCTTTGTLYPKFRSEVNGSLVTVQPNSIFKVREI